MSFDAPCLRISRFAPASRNSRPFRAAETAATAFPSRPTLELRGAQRELLGHPDVTAFNGSVTLSQEIEIAGQRGARLEVVDAEVRAANLRVDALTRETRPAP